jgi:hypothetical protein
MTAPSEMKSAAARPRKFISLRIAATLPNALANFRFDFVLESRLIPR